MWVDPQVIVDLVSTTEFMSRTSDNLWKSVLSSTMWVLGMQVRLSHLAASAFNHLASLFLCLILGLNIQPRLALNW